MPFVMVDLFAAWNEHIFEGLIRQIIEFTYISHTHIMTTIFELAKFAKCTEIRELF